MTRFCRQIAGHGYIVAAPSSYHEFTGPEPLAYDGPGTDAGNEWKVKKVPESCCSSASFALAAHARLGVLRPRTPIRTDSQPHGRPSPHTTKTQPSRSRLSLPFRPVRAGSARRGCAWEGTWRIDVPWIRESLPLFATSQPTSIRMAWGRG